MKKALRTASRLAAGALIVAASLGVAPASALELLNAAGQALPAIPGIEMASLGLIGLGCLGLARQRANV